jgi:integral membrane protein (TIGR01906 family)
MKNALPSLLSWLVTLLTPLFLIGLALRIMLAPWFLHVEYRMPYFPPDEYGFTTEDRLHWAPFALDYVINDANVSYLADLKFADGTPLYNARELSHMQDVQHVVQWALRTWLVGVAVMTLLAIWAWRSVWVPAYLRGLRRGGWFMLALGAALAVFAATSFWQFFTLFHELFFTGDTWLFEYSDTLIRLFPLRFWEDVFMWVGLIVIGSALGLALGIKGKAVIGQAEAEDSSLTAGDASRD